MLRKEISIEPEQRERRKKNEKKQSAGRRGNWVSREEVGEGKFG